MSDICESLLVIEPAVDRLEVHLREFLDYLDFEIEKTDLEIKQMRWRDKVDPAALKETEAWLQRMQQLKTDFSVDIMTSPPRTVREMLKRVQRLFDDDL